MSLKYAVVFEKAPENWAAYVPDLPGCITTGYTLAEAETNIREAIEGHLRTLHDFGDPIPPPSTVAREIEIIGLKLFETVRVRIPGSSGMPAHKQGLER